MKSRVLTKSAVEDLSESGVVDFVFILMPIMICTFSLIAMFQYGLAVNTLTHNSVMIGRELARFPDIENLEALTESKIRDSHIEISDYHVMRYSLGDHVFIQLILVGKPLRLGPSTITPSGKSLTPADSWN